MRISRVSKLIAIVVSGLGLANCQTVAGTHGASASSAAEPMFLRRAAQPGEIYLTASASGILSLRNGCFALNKASIIWPSNAQLTRDTQGRISILNRTSGVSVRIGDRIAMGGGEVDRFNPGALDLGGSQLGRCPGPYFLADDNFRPG